MPRNRIVTAAALRERLIRELLDEDSDWDLAHDRNRPPKYYPDGNDEAVVLTILDSLAAVAVPLSQRDLLNRVKSSAEPTGDEQIRGLLRLLLADHYLPRDNEGRYSFRLEIVRRWWELDRGL